MFHEGVRGSKIVFDFFVSVAFAAAAGIMDAVRSVDAHGHEALMHEKWGGPWADMVEACEKSDEQASEAAASKNSAPPPPPPLQQLQLQQ
jgi:hypothetical protein